MPSVLILGGRAPVAADHARRFAHQGWTVFIGDSNSCRISGWSQAVKATIPLASPRFASAAFIDGLARAIRAHAIDLVVPTCEEVFYLSRYRHRLPSSCRIAVDDFDKLRTMHSKWEFQLLARACSAHSPRTEVVDSIATARAWAGNGPVVLKPEFSRFGVHVRLYPNGIAPDAPELEALGRWVVQQYCPGQELCSYSIADQGRLLAHAVYLPKYRLQRSSSYYFEPHAAPAIAHFVEEFVARHQFTGQISFDWIDAGDGKPAVIECNPRAISGLHMFSTADAVPAALTGEAATRIAPAIPRARMIAPVMLTAGLVQSLASGRFAEWQQDFRNADDVIAPAGDYQPFFGAVADSGACFIKSLRQKCTMREASTRDIEWDGEPLPQP
jgi:hypothetical protein